MAHSPKNLQLEDSASSTKDQDPSTRVGNYSLSHYRAGRQPSDSRPRKRPSSDEGSDSSSYTEPPTSSEVDEMSITGEPSTSDFPGSSSGRGSPSQHSEMVGSSDLGDSVDHSSDQPQPHSSTADPDGDARGSSLRDGTQSGFESLASSEMIAWPARQICELLEIGAHLELPSDIPDEEGGHQELDHGRHQENNDEANDFPLDDDEQR